MFELFGSVLDSPAGCMKLPLSFESVDQTLCCDHSLIQDFFIMKKNHLVPMPCVAITWLSLRKEFKKAKEDGYYKLRLHLRPSFKLSSLVALLLI